MAKKKQKVIIPFNEEGMRTFNDVRSAISYFTKNGNIPQNKIVALFQNAFMIVSGKYSVNVIDLQFLKDEEFRKNVIEIFKKEETEYFERTLNVFSENMKIWKEKFTIQM